MHSAFKLTLGCVPLICSCSLLFSSSDEAEDAGLTGDATAWIDAVGDATSDARAAVGDAMWETCDRDDIRIESEGGGAIGTGTILRVVTRHMTGFTEVGVAMTGVGDDGSQLPPRVITVCDTQPMGPDEGNNNVWHTVFAVSVQGTYTATFYWTDDSGGGAVDIDIVSCSFFVPYTGTVPKSFCPVSL